MPIAAGTRAVNLRAAVSADAVFDAEIVLPGIVPREPDPELGYILPLRNGRGKYAAADRFVEKPSRAEAERLIHHGALWNACIIAANAAALLSLFEQRYPQIVRDMRRLVKGNSTTQHSGETLAAPECGWSDLGTPARVAAALHELPTLTEVATRVSHSRAPVNLAAQHELLRVNPAKAAFGHPL